MILPISSANQLIIMQKKLGQLAYLFGQFHGHSEVILDGLGGRGLLLLMLLLVM